MSKIAILGTVGVPAGYGGFETLAENLVRYNYHNKKRVQITVWCSGRDVEIRRLTFLGARLRYVEFHANGVQSLVYDAVSIVQAVLARHSTILLLGVSGAYLLPFVRFFSTCRVVTNIDGIEWRRAKWSRSARYLLRFLEGVAVRFSHEVIADNQAIAEYVLGEYGRECQVIAYGGDHALIGSGDCLVEGLPNQYALALCRIEPENNIHLILEAFESVSSPIVCVGNWDKTAYGRELRVRYAGNKNYFLLDPEYDAAKLRAIRSHAVLYIHGHSAGGTNPSLVEMMHFGIPIIAHGCSFNRHSTEGRARYFDSAEELIEQLNSLGPRDAEKIGIDMREIAKRKYTWDEVGKAYFELLERA